jgi:hypothetical protein
MSPLALAVVSRWMVTSKFFARARLTHSSSVRLAAGFAGDTVWAKLAGRIVVKARRLATRRKEFVMDEMGLTAEC